MKKHIWILLLLFVLSESLLAKEQFGRIVKFEGDVSIGHAGSSRKEKVTKENTAVFESDTIHTGNKSKVYLLFHDKSQMILKSNTEFKIRRINDVEIKKGSGLFSILKRITKKRRKRLILRTATVIIGVKGTQYMVKMVDKDTQVFLKSGKLSIESASGEYLKLYNRTEDEYQAAIRKAEQEYKDFKEKAEDEYSEMVQSFSLEAGQAIDVSSESAKRIPFSREIKAEFDAFESF
jgi:hypothetical protein